MSLVGFKARNHPQQVAKPAVDDRALPPEYFADLNARFKFTVDAAAAPHNAKLSRFFTAEDDGLSKSWAGERVYCNPPYSNIEPWLEKAWESVGAELIVMLLPANRTEQGWWQRHVEPYRDRPGAPLRVEFLKGRLRFIQAGKSAVGMNERPPFGCCLCIWTA